MNQKGQALIEILLVIALTAIMLPALMTGLFASRQGKVQQDQRAQAIALIKESEEVIRSIREKGWDNFAVNGTYYPVVNGNAWAFASGSETINNLTRTITVSDVYRGQDGTIVEFGGTLDSSTKKIHIEVTWGKPYPSLAESTIYLSRYLNNGAYTQTTESEFNTGTISQSLVTNTSGGEITLGLNLAKWCSPTLSSSTITLVDGPPVAVSATVSATTSEPNQVFVATAPTASSSTKMVFVNVTANELPPIPSLNGTFTLDSSKYSLPGLVPSGIELDNNFRTNDIQYYESPSGKLYALIATTKPDKEVIAVLVDDNDDSNNNTNNGEFQDYVNKIYKYHTFFNTQAYDTSGSTDTGFASPNAENESSGGDGDGFESNPTRAYTNNSSFAVDNNSGSGTGTSCTGTDKDKHIFYNYNFGISSGATISGIEVRLDARADSTTGSPKMCVQLSWDGGTTWTTAQSTSNLTTSEATYTLGGSSNTWGRTWTSSDFSNANFRLRVINVASNTSRDFSLDWAAVKVYYAGGIINDQAPFDYGATSIAIQDNTGYVSSGGYLYAFDLSEIDSKNTTQGLDIIGCRIQLDGYDCNPGSGTDRKYAAGESGTSWSDTTSPAHNDCYDGGNIELYANNDIAPVKVGSSTYIFTAIGAGTNPEFGVVNTTSIPTTGSSPTINNSSCGRISGGNSGWKQISTLDFNSQTNTEEAANSVYAKSDGTRAYISSNGGIDANNNGIPDSHQFYVINTSNKSAPAFLSGTSATGATSGYYYGSSPNHQLYPKRSLTVLNGKRAVLVGRDGTSDANDASEYQVLNIDSEASPAFCGSVNFNQGFNDLTSVSEADGDNFVYMVANTTVNELKIIQGGPDGNYVESGTYESAIYDLGALVALNRISATTSLPTGTNIRYQVAAALKSGGSCNGETYTFVGPDGTSDSYFNSGGGTIPFTNGSFKNPAECVKYKAFFTTTDVNVSPVLYDVTINYSP